MNKLTEAGYAAQRALLLATCEQEGWHLTRVAQRLGCSSGGNVIRYLRDLAPEEYAAARRDGRIRHGGSTRRKASPRRETADAG